MHRWFAQAAVGTVLLASCGGAASSSVSPSASAPGGGPGQALSLTAQDYSFSPAALTATSGSATISVTNNGSVLHSFTLDDGSVSVDVPPGTTQKVTLDLTGPVSFHCHYHPTQMLGTITVDGATAAPPAPATSAATTPRY